MARPQTVPALTSAQARYVLEKLIDERKVSAADVRRHLGGMWREMSFLEKRLAELRSMIEPVKHPVRAVKRALTKAKRARRKLSATTRASYKLQGQYLGYMKQIAVKDRAKFKRMAKEQGREKAVAAMKKALGK